MRIVVMPLGYRPHPGPFHPMKSYVAPSPFMKNHSSASRKPSKAALLLLAAFATVNVTNAASLTWDGADTTTTGAQGGSGIWNVNSNVNWWDGSANVVWPALGGTDDDAVFAGTAGTVTLGSDITANDLTFNTTGYTISGPQTLTLNGAATSNMTTGTGVTATISSVIAGSAGFTKSGAGTLILTGNSTNNGAISISAGTLQIGSNGTTGSLGSGVVTASAATLAFNRTDSVAAPFVVNNQIKGANGGAIATIVVNSGAVQFGGTTDNSDAALDVRSGATAILAKASNGLVHVFGKASTVRSGGTLQLAGTGGDQIWDSAPLTVSSGGVFDVNSRSEAYASLTLAGTGISGGGALINSTNTATSTLTGNISLSGATTVGGLGNITTGSVISGTGTGLTKIGAGTLTLNGSAVNTFTGGLNVNGGTVALNLNSLATPTNLVDSTNALTLGGGTLSVTGKTSGATAQTFASTNATAGTSTILLNRNGGTSGTLNLGNVTHAPGGVVNFTTATAMSGTVSTTEMIKVSNTVSANSTLGAWAVANGPTTSTGRWVVVDPSGTLKLVTALNNTNVASIDTDWSGINSASSVYTASTSVTVAGNPTAQAIQNNNTNNNNVTVALGTNTLTVNGLSTIQSGANNLWTFTSSGAGGIRIGSERELVLIGAGNFAFSAPISNNASGASGLTHAGGGTVTLSGNNTFSGQTTVNSGIMQLAAGGSVNSSNGIKINGGTFLQNNTSTAVTPAVSVQGGTLGGTGTINSVSVTNLVSNTLANGSGAVGSTGALTVGNLTFSGAATVNINSGGSAGLNVTGALTTTPANGKVVLNVTTAPIWASGSTYNLISYGSFNGTAGDFTKGTIAYLGGRKTATLGTTGSTSGSVTLSITGENTLWTGAAGGNWTTNAVASPFSWKTQSGGADTQFLSQDDVIFDDTGITTALNISDANVTPNTVTFNNSSKDYTVSSSGAFGITNGILIKNGSGNLTLNTANTYAGGTYLNAGRIISTRNLPGGTTAVPVLASIASGATLEYAISSGNTTQGATSYTGAGTIQKTGAGTLILGGSTSVVAMSAGGKIDVQAGTFRADDGAQTTNFTNNLGDINIASGATFDSVGALVRADKLTGTGIYQAGLNGPRSITVGVNNGNSTFGGTFQNNGNGSGNGAALIKTGTGTFTLSGTVNITNNSSDTNSGNDVIRVTGGTVASPSTLTLSPAGTSVIGSTATNNTLSIAPSQNDNSVFNQTAGTVNSTSISIGNTGVGTYNLSGGALNTRALVMAFTGPTSGTGEAKLNVSGSSVLNLVSNGTITMGTFFGRTATITQTGGTVALYADLAGTTLGGTGSLAFNGSSNTSAYNLNGGTLAIPAITLRASGGGAGGGSGIMNLAGGILKITSSAFTVPTVATKTIAFNVLGNSTVANSGANIDTNGNTVNFNAPLVHAGNSTLDGGLTKLGAGTLTLSSTNTYTGPTTVQVGTLALGHATNTLADSGAVNITGGTLDIGANSDTVGVVTLTGGSITGSTGVLTGSAYNVESGTISARLGGGGALTKSTGGTVTLSGVNTYTGNTTINGGTLQVDGALGATAVILNSGSLKVGSTGSISSATISINGGSFDATALVGGYTVGSGQTIKGTGTYSGNVIVGSGGTLAPGNSPGVVTFSGDLTLSGTTALEINGTTRGTDFDGVNLTGTSNALVYGGALSMSFNAVPAAAVYDLFQIAGTVSQSGTFGSVTIGGSAVASSTAASITGSGWTATLTDNVTSAVWNLSFDNATGDLTVTAIPEPATYAVLAGVASLGLAAYRRRRQQKTAA